MVIFYHNPYDKDSRNKLNELQSLGALFEIHDYTHINANRKTWISFLPSVVLHDDDGTEICRAEHIDNITKRNIDWMHKNHADWKGNGRKNKFPTPPWKG